MFVSSVWASLPAIKRCNGLGLVRVSFKVSLLALYFLNLYLVDGAISPAIGHIAVLPFNRSNILCGLSLGKVAVSWLKIVADNPNLNPTMLSHETATLPCH